MSREDLRLKEAYLGQGNAYNAEFSRQSRSTLEKDQLHSQLPSTLDEDTTRCDNDSLENTDSKTKIPNDIKQQILRQLAIETIVYRSLYERVAEAQSNLQ